MFPQPTDRCVRVIKHILLAPRGSKGSLVDLESIKRIKALWLHKRRQGEGEATPLCHYPPIVLTPQSEALISFNSENVALDQFKIDLLKLTDYPALYHKRMGSRTL